jgi:hypothetical protein
VSAAAPRTLGEMRETGARRLIVFCADYKCSHNITLSPAEVDKWPDDVRLSELEPRFVCKVCGKRGADIRPDFKPARRTAEALDQGQEPHTSCDGSRVMTHGGGPAHSPRRNMYRA